jgi:small-conductance mechanosensitive channel
MATELLAGIVGLVDVVGSNAGRILITVAVLGGLAGLKQFVNRWRRDQEVSSRLALAVSAVLAVLLASGLFALVAVWGLTGVLYNAYAGVDLGTQVANIVLSVAIIGVSYAVSDFLGHVIKDLAKQQTAISEHEREILHRVSQVTIYTFALLVVVGLFTDNIGSILVGAGFLGIVVGMAARQTLGAVLAGFVLMFSKPFEVGDWVVIGEDEGIVSEITIVNTRIQSVDGEYVVIPNDLVSGNPVINRTRRGRLRIEVEVGVDYRTDPDEAGEIAVEAVSELDRILNAPSPQVVGKEFGDSSVVLGVRGWIDQPSARRRWRARTGMISAIKRAFADNGIKIPYPQRELSGRAETGGFRLADGEQSTEPREVDGEGSAAVSTDGESTDKSDSATRKGQAEPRENGDND